MPMSFGYWGIVYCPLLVALLWTVWTHADEHRPNVLFIAVDDLNDYALGLHPTFRADTPHMTRLANSGVLFTNAHCAAPVCNPSRVSVITGLSPSTSGVYVNKDDWRDFDSLKSVRTLPEHFRINGYKVIGGGKLYHAANLSTNGLKGFFDPRPWSEYFPSKDRQLADDFVPPGNAVNGSNQFYGGRFDWEALDVPDDEMGDGKVVAWAEQQLARTHDRPLFLSVGIYRPHIPWYTPKHWFDRYPLGQIKLPNDPASDVLDLPEIAQLSSKQDWHLWLRENDKWKEATQAYLASVYQRKNHSIRSDRWRYIRYSDGSEELYDHRTDPGERNNLAQEGALDRVKQRLSGFLPKTDAPQANYRKLRSPRSAMSAGG
ncbi:MAG: sulfatase-like hydrolase/transferase [Planctomycetota bacterium]